LPADLDSQESAVDCGSAAHSDESARDDRHHCGEKDFPFRGAVLPVWVNSARED
jgi:hypothetical protein